MHGAPSPAFGVDVCITAKARTRQSWLRPSNSCLNRYMRVTPFLLTLFLVSGCASQAPDYDPNARESVGRIVLKTAVGERVQARADSPNMGPALAGGLGGLGLVIGAVLQKKTTWPVFEYRISLEDGREVVATSDYSGDYVGKCVKVFESSQPTYPRFVSSDQCSVRSTP